MIRLELLLDLIGDAWTWLARVTRRWPLAAWFVHSLLFSLFAFALLDRLLARWFKIHLDGTQLEGFFKTVTNLGEGGLWLVPSALAWIYCRWKLSRSDYFDQAARFRRWSDSLLYFFLTVGMSGIFVNLVKVVIGRYRPRALFEQGLYGFHPFSTDWAINSFPSGHSQAAFAAMTALVFILPRYDLAWLALAVLVAVSRVATSVHYLSDVAMGSYVGIAAAILMHRAFIARGIQVTLKDGRE